VKRREFFKKFSLGFGKFFQSFSKERDFWIV